MEFTVLTLFPEMVQPLFDHGMIARGIAKKIIQGRCINIRDFSSDRHNTVDDRPYGGGSGMVMKPEPLNAAILRAKQQSPSSRVILTTPQGRPFCQAAAEKMARAGQGIIFICGRYEGIDERVYAAQVDDEFSIGDYVMTGGELAAMVMIDAVARLIPGVLGCSASSQSDSFTNDRLEYAQYTRPEDFEGMRVPEILLSGDHQKIEDWRNRSAFQRTYLKRPDLLTRRPLTQAEKDIAREWSRELNDLAKD